jgi:GntR family transcriptional regulator, rspAB operon transcriptional repressor
MTKPRDDGAGAGAGAARSRAPRRGFATPKLLESGGAKTSLVQRVHQTILDELDEGVLRPGQRLVAAELAERLNLSRAPVREALHVLAGQGLVDLHPDRGAVLRTMSRDDLSDIYEVIAPVAALGVAAAARRIDEDDNRRKIEDAIEKIRRSADVQPRFKFYLVLNEFHYVANAIGRKPYVDTVLRSVNLEYWNRLLAEVIDLRVQIPHYVRNYERLADAILAGDARAASAIVLTHCEWCMQIIEAGIAHPHEGAVPRRIVDI